MPISPSDIDALPDFTPAQQLKVWQKASVDIALTGQHYDQNGRTLTRADLAEVQKMIAFWQAQVNADNGTGDIALVQFGEAQ